MFGNASYAYIDKLVGQDNAVSQNIVTFVDDADNDNLFILTSSQQLRPSYIVLGLSFSQPRLPLVSVISAGIRIRSPPLSSC